MGHLGFDTYGIRKLALGALVTASFVGLCAVPVPASAAPKAVAKDAKKPAGKAPPKSAPADTDNDDIEDEDSPKPKSSTVAGASSEPASLIREGTPPKPPKAGDGGLQPYVPPAESVMLRKDRHVTLSAVAGVWSHGLNGADASSKAGPVWGASGRVDPYRWLGVSVTILRGNQPVTPNPGALGVPGAQLQQPDFQIIHWSIRIEPTWHVTPLFALWMGSGIGWGRVIAPEPTVINRNWVSEDRSSVYVDAQLAVGAKYEVIRDWIELNLALSGSSLGYQHGSALDPVQAFTPEGHMTHIGGYPNLSHKVQGLFGIGVIL